MWPMVVTWLVFCILDLCLEIVALLITPFLCLFTANGWPKWGGWFWTYDNPPQGDGGFQAKRAPYVPAVTAWERYFNRVAWLYRNPTYGFSRLLGVPFERGCKVEIARKVGNGINISDKYRRAGYYLAICRDVDDIPIAFEFYMVLPWSDTQCLRVRLGWKIMSDKFTELRFAPLVHMVNPLKSYGE
jgi:hypothetical protein